MNIALGLLRMKVAAVILGPAGVGLIGVLQNLMGTIGTLASLGIGTSGTRQVARADQPDALDVAGIGVVTQSLRWLVLLLAVLSAAATWWLREPLAELVLGDVRYASQVGWLSVGIFFSVAAGSQGALLAGFRRIGDQARLAVWSGLLATGLGIAALLWLGDAGLLWFVLVAPVVTYALSWYYVRRLPQLADGPFPQALPSQLGREALELVRLGLPFMVAGLGSTAGVLIVRAALARELGDEALGHFHATWAISMTYLSFVLGAMARDYYPRLTEKIHDPQVAAQMVDEQAEVALLLAGPVLVLAIGLAPFVLRLLYSEDFQPAADTLRWQMLANVLKVASWPLGFILLAKGKSMLFMLTELLVMAIFVGCVLALLGRFRLEATGLAFLVMYLVYLPLIACVVWRLLDYRWPRQVAMQFLRLLVISAAVVVLAMFHEMAAAVVSVALSVFLAAVCWRRLIPLLRG